nr:immunoglobulin heavy chain junction region [Macaca mulatta]
CARDGGYSNYPFDYW